MWSLFIMQIFILLSYFMNFVHLLGIIGKKINSHCELVTSQPHWFFGSQPDISKFSILNNFLIYCPICMKFAPNSLVWELLWLWLGFAFSDPFPLRPSYPLQIIPLFSEKHARMTRWDHVLSDMKWPDNYFHSEDNRLVNVYVGLPMAT